MEYSPLGFLPNWNPRPPDLTHTSTGCLLGSSNKTSITSLIIRRLDFKGHLEEIEEDHTFNTSDPHDDAVFLHNDGAKDHDNRGVLNDMDPLPQDVVAKEHLQRKALETIGNPFFTRGVVKDASLGKSSLSIDSPLSWLIT